jgi:diguanylate cyclase (GGDEF)-like protein
MGMRLTHDSGRNLAPALSRHRLESFFVLACSAGAMAVVYGLDRWTSLPAIQHLYYFPIVFAAITLGMTGGIGAAAVAIVLYHLANPQFATLRYEESDFLQMAVFLAVGIVAARLAEDTRRLRRLAMTDDLTGLHNLRSFELELNRIMREALARRQPVVLMVMDVDRLKSLNDGYGHLAGAEAVRTVGRLVAECMPPEAVACRYGGDEFVIALPNHTVSTASVVADTLRATVHAAAPELAGQRFPQGTLSISIGLVVREFNDRLIDISRQTTDELGEPLFRAADEALYIAKRAGRNQVHVGGSVSGPIRTTSQFNAS